jgi:asparagine synthetase B (glutamine-hydrolysing)
MCGIFYILSKKKNNILNKQNLKYIIEKIKYRGPDYTNIVYDKNNIFIHTLLAIQGFNPQPYKTNNGLFLFNGEIYGTSSLKESIQKGVINYNNITHKNESKFLEDFIENKNGLDKLDELDGEFVINYFDKKNNLLHIISDPFGTKPFCWYIDENNFIASSYESCVKKTIELLNLNKNSKIEFIIPNTHYIFNLNNYKLINKKEIIKWDFNPRFNNFDRWNIAFENSIKKRTNTDKGIFVPLSSGYDSGCIVSAMLNLNKKFKTYTFKGKEDINTLEKRKKLIEENNKFFYINPKENIKNKYMEYCKRIENYIGYHVNGQAYTNIYEAYSCFGIYQIFQKARKDKQIIFLSGHGGDEIFSDYGNESNKSASILELDYTNVRSKWPNFDSAYGRNIIQMFERVAGCFGIESRYPFLDKQVVQEFLWLSDTLKNSEFKQCISQYMIKKNFPFLKNKKCSVRVITDKEGGNEYFFNVLKEILNSLKIKINEYNQIENINKELYRPTLNNKPVIKYYP